MEHADRNALHLAACAECYVAEHERNLQD